MTTVWPPSYLLMIELSHFASMSMWNSEQNRPLENGSFKRIMLLAQMILLCKVIIRPQTTTNTSCSDNTLGFLTAEIGIWVRWLSDCLLWSLHAGWAINFRTGATALCREAVTLAFDGMRHCQNHTWAVHNDAGCPAAARHDGHNMISQIGAKALIIWAAPEFLQGCLSSPVSTNTKWKIPQRTIGLHVTRAVLKRQRADMQWWSFRGQPIASRLLTCLLLQAVAFGISVLPYYQAAWSMCHWDWCSLPLGWCCLSHLSCIYDWLLTLSFE